MTAIMTPAKLTAAQRKQQHKLAEDRQARDDATAWVEANHPDEVWLVAALGKRGTKARPWDGISPSHGLTAHLTANGREYAAAFLDEVDARWQWIDLAWRFATYAEGTSDGQRWASDFATPDQLERLRTALRNSGRRILVDTEFKDDELSAAHSLLTWTLGHDAYQRQVVMEGEEEYEEFDSDCDVFKSFWQPFFAEPMDEVIDSVHAEGTDAKCKLMEPGYIRGFIDGATGLSGQLRADHLV